MSTTSEADEREGPDPPNERADRRARTVPAGHLRAVRTVFDASPFGVAVWSVEGELLHANPVFADLVDRTPAALVGEQFATFIDPVDEPAILAAVEDLWNGERNYFECEIRCRDENGAELWLRAHLHAVYGDGGRPGYLVSQVFSFAGRHAAPAARPIAPAEVTAEPADPPEVSPESGPPVLLWFLGTGDDAHGAAPGDAGSAEFLGLPAGRSTTDVADALFAGVHADDRGGFETEWWARWGAREPFGFTARIRRSDGEWRWMAHRARPCFRPDGRFDGYAGASLDVTDDEVARRRLDGELERFRALVEAGPLPVTRIDATGAVVYASPRWDALLDDPATRLTGFGWQDLLVPEDAEALTRLGREAIHTREPFTLRVRVRDTLALNGPAGGRRARFWGDLRVAPVSDSDGRHDGFVATLADISTQMAATELAERLAEVLAAGSDYVVVERHGALSYVNRAAEEELGVVPARSGEAGPFLLDILVPDSYDFFHRTVRDVLADSRLWTGELVVRHRSGREVPVSVLALAHSDLAGDVESITVVARDISDLKQAHSRMSELATHDYLTGLPNRVLLYERVDLALSRHKRSGQTVALLFLDLDRFKPINDELGHHVGDAVLVALADRMHEAVRDTDTVARIGGDEFAVLVEGYESHSLLERVAERLISAVSEPIEVEGTMVQVGVSIGIVAADATTADADALLSRADAAMYEAKAAGRGCYIFASSQPDAAAAHDVEDTAGGAGAPEAADADDGDTASGQG
jgi:diguanylate cyclase (GGDEF)-like protein/PAS domain S-box-containing protein